MVTKREISVAINVIDKDLRSKKKGVEMDTDISKIRDGQEKARSRRAGFLRETEDGVKETISVTIVEMKGLARRRGNQNGWMSHWNKRKSKRIRWQNSKSGSKE